MASRLLVERGDANPTLHLEGAGRAGVDVGTPRVPFHDVLVQDVRRFAVGRSVEEVTLRYDDLNAYLAATGRPITLAPAGDRLLRATGSVEVLGRRLQIQATVLLTVSGGDLRVSPHDINTNSSGLGGAAQALLRQRLTLSVPLGTLPFGHDLTSVNTTQDAVTAAR